VWKTVIIMSLFSSAIAVADVVFDKDWVRLRHVYASDNTESRLVTGIDQ
jgi:hypothetical protein